MTPEQRARLEQVAQHVRVMNPSVVHYDDIAAALAHIDALAAEVERLKASETEAAGLLKETTALVREWQARATAAEQRLAELEGGGRYSRSDMAKHDAILALYDERTKRQQAEARLREVETRILQCIDASWMGYRAMTDPSLTLQEYVSELRAAKEQAEQTAAALREALEQVLEFREPVYHPVWIIARDALHGQAAQEDARG